YKIDGQDIAVQVLNLTVSKTLDWAIIVVIPNQDIFGFVYSSNNVIYGVITGGLIVSIIAAIVLTLLITNPLSKLSNQMKDVSRMSLEMITENSSFLNEVYNIQMSFFSMVYALRSFKKYVPEAVIKNTMITNQVATLGLVSKDATYFFLDIVDFTSLSEALSPDDLLILIGGAMEELTNIIIENRGFVDKYIGDAIMALWNVPTKVDDAQVLAVTAAIRCTEKLKMMDDEFEERGLPKVRCRIGVHHGHALIGNFGSSQRLNYTALGDNVNLAARLEPLCKYYNVDVLISGETRNLIKHRIVCRAVDIVTVKGRSQETVIYEPLALKSEATTSHIAIETLSEEIIQDIKLMRTESAEKNIASAMCVEGYENDISLTMLRDRCITMKGRGEQKAFVNTFSEKHF
ncbi:hypothetical protein AKO1_009653, partial [Acrasis kona]